VASHTAARLTMVPKVLHTSTEGNELSMMGFVISKILSCVMGIMDHFCDRRCGICHTARQRLGPEHRRKSEARTEPHRGEADDGSKRAAHEHIGERRVGGEAVMANIL
jgi:hypothetical protein